MDGFYVAKIQKLSDKRKGEEDKKEQDAKMATDDVIKENAVKAEVSNESKKKKKQQRQTCPCPCQGRTLFLPSSLHADSSSLHLA